MSEDQLKKWRILMNDFSRGMEVGLQLAVDSSEELKLSMEHFSTADEFKAYCKGVEDYKKKLEEVRDA